MVKVLLIAFVLTSAGAGAQIPRNDSATARASLKYSRPGFLKRFIMGSNYRTEWQTPVRLPIFSATALGLTAKELGGGQQTKSLRFEDRKGRNWVLRTVDKDVEKVLPPFLRKTLARRVTQDMISASHPYGSVTVPTLSKALGIAAPEPVFYYVTDDPSLGEYRTIFANQVCLLERRDPTPDDTESENTEDLLEDIFDENDHLVIQEKVLTARLMDMLLGDWDRHADQWRWGKNEVGKEDLYYAIPRDRDQALFYSDGALINFVRLFAMKHLVGYQLHLNKLKYLNYKTWKFDRLFLNSLDRQQWDSSIKRVQATLTDDLIHQAMSKLPPEIYALNGTLLESKMRNRRDELLQEGMKYYRFLSQSVNYYGTDQQEFFRVSGIDNDLLVQVYEWKAGQPGRKIYERRFSPRDTWQVRLHGLGGDDRFQIQESAASRIRVQFAGGDGTDSYTINGGKRNWIIDSKTGADAISGRVKAKRIYN